MPLLENAQNFMINNGQFTENTHNFNGSSGIDILCNSSCPEAAVDSNARRYAPSCFPGTREQHIQDIMHWALPSPGGPWLPVNWMKGPGGVGKSALAQTCAERLKEQGFLGAAYFFSINGRDDYRSFFPSLAYQLAIGFPEYRRVVDEKVCADKTLVSKTMASQFRGLIVEPLQVLEATGKGIRRRAVIIDGLDECADKNAQCEIIEIIAASAKDKTTPFCWAFFSRPEPHIEATFTKAIISPVCNVVFLPISREINGEIELYLRDGLQNILRHRNITTRQAWPAERDVKALVEASDGLFIYAATVLRFMNQDGSFREPDKLLRAVLDISSRRDSHGTVPVLHRPFAELDAFYSLILERIPQDLLSSIQLLFSNMLLGEWNYLARHQPG